MAKNRQYYKTMIYFRFILPAKIMNKTSKFLNNKKMLENSIKLGKVNNRLISYD